MLNQKSHHQQLQVPKMQWNEGDTTFLRSNFKEKIEAGSITLDAVKSNKDVLQKINASLKQIYDKVRNLIRYSPAKSNVSILHSYVIACQVFVIFLSKKCYS